MSEKIPTIGKVWLIFLGVLATIGIISNALGIANNGIVYLISTVACVGELIGIIFMLKGNGLPYYVLYGVCYAANAIIVALLSNNISTAWLVGFIFGVSVNLGLTYLSIKDTLNLKKGE